MPRVVVAIPARDEAARITGCLGALARQRQVGPDAVVLVANNCRDATAERAQALAPVLPFALEIIERDFPAALACAGIARRIGMQRAAALAGADGVVLTTDADGRAAPDWIAANLRALHAGVDAVAGRAVIDPREAALIPAHLHEADAQECAYAALLDEIASLHQPDPADPWPRHQEESGASIAVGTGSYRRAGGMPPAALAEDRAFFAAQRRIDARIRHAPEVSVVVSGRTLGRAAGGMADTIRRRLVEPDLWLDERLEPAADRVRRLALRGRARDAWRRGTAPATLAAMLGLPVPALAAALAHTRFGAAWAAIEAASPKLVARRVAVADLPREAARARRVRAALRRAADRAERPARVIAERA